MKDEKDITTQIQEIANAFSSLCEALSLVFVEVTKTVQKLYDTFYALYLERGAIYGETHDGMMRWYDALHAIEGSAEEAEPCQPVTKNYYSEDVWDQPTLHKETK